MKGFTLLETIIVVSIMALFTAFSYHFFNQKPLLLTSTHEIVGFLHKSMVEASALNQTLEVQFSTSSGQHKLTLYHPQTYSTLDTLILHKDISLSLSPTMDTLKLAPFSPVLSAAYYGYPSSISEKATLSLSDHRNESKNIDIYLNSGAIDHD